MVSYDLKKLHELPLKIQLLFISIICLIVLYFGYSFDITSLRRQLNSAKQQEQDLKIQLNPLINEKQKLNYEIAQFKKIKDEIKTWQDKMVNANELSDLLNEILKLGTANHLTFDFFNPGARTKQDSYFNMPIKTVVLGNYNDLGNFLSQIANMNWIVLVDNFVISKNLNKLYEKSMTQQEGYADLLRAELNLEVYYMAEQK